MEEYQKYLTSVKHFLDHTPNKGYFDDGFIITSQTKKSVYAGFIPDIIRFKDYYGYVDYTVNIYCEEGIIDGKKLMIEEVSFYFEDGGEVEILIENIITL